ncbi:hypothetical protein CPB83DRAFT_831504 [Crepidotus variabilis]|uniref:Uncharacterized protein n=1 Tax=Crepidotus variabilis TaxID=179855 RepID=A0A9P6ESP1_9AGAR|nr:hypothetical protein CPB83DRAFT_831504 [Crepidotus variabilis]
MSKRLRTHRADWSNYSGSPAQLKDKYEELLAFYMDKPGVYYCGVDGAVPKQRKYQASACALVYKGSKRIKAIRQPAGKLTSMDAELQAICMAVADSSSKSDIQPTHAKLGSWLPSVMDLWTDGDGMDHPALNPLVARLVWCITNHAPIEPVNCSCGWRQDRHHIFLGCQGHLDALNSTLAFLWQVVKFLRDNPLAFGFPQRQGQLAAPDPPREGEG